MKIIKELMELGILVEPEAGEKLKSLDESMLDMIISRSKEERPLVLTPEIVQNYLKSTNFKIIKTIEKKKTYKVQDVVDDLNKRYDFIQNLLMRKVELSNIVSINKCSNGKLTVIAIVKDKKKEKNNVILELEDKTGTVKAVISEDISKTIKLDDVIAVYGNYSNNLLFVEKIMYPDVPLRKVNYSKNDIKIAFIINHDFSEKLEIDADYIFIGNCDNTDKAKQMYPLSKIFSIGKEIKGLYYIPNPSLVEIDDIIILTLLDIDPLNILKKRYISIDNNDFLIDTLPDIILTNKDINTNYKAISIISGKTKIDLKSRDVSKI